MGVCAECGQEERTYTLDGGEFCRDCYLDRIESPAVIEENLLDFVGSHEKEFVGWITDTSNGDPYQIEDYVDRMKSKAVREWAERNPKEYQEAMDDFRTSCPGEWEDYMEGLQ